MNLLIPRIGITTLVALLIVAAGCSKKDSAQSPPPAAEPTATPAQTAAPQVNNPATPNVAADATLRDAQTAMQSKDYEKAASALLKVQTQPKALTTEQAQAVRNQMVQLQRDIAGGVAAGDPKAKAAAEMLRQSTMR